MTINQALEILYDLDTTSPQFAPELRREAVKLSIEALGRIKRQRTLEIPINQPLLPGETII